MKVVTCRSKLEESKIWLNLVKTRLLWRVIINGLNLFAAPDQYLMIRLLTHFKMQKKRFGRGGINLRVATRLKDHNKMSLLLKELISIINTFLDPVLKNQ